MRIPDEEAYFIGLSYIYHAIYGYVPNGDYLSWNKVKDDIEWASNLEYQILWLEKLVNTYKAKNDHQ